MTLFGSDQSILKVNINYEYADDRQLKVIGIPAEISREIADSKNEVADFLYYSRDGVKRVIVAINAFDGKKICRLESLVI